MNDLAKIAANALALFIVIGFLLLIYLKVRRQTFGDFYVQIKDWVGGR